MTNEELAAIAKQVEHKTIVPSETVGRMLKYIKHLEAVEHDVITERDTRVDEIEGFFDALGMGEEERTWSNLNNPVERAMEYIDELVTEDMKFKLIVDIIDAEVTEKNL